MVLALHMEHVEYTYVHVYPQRTRNRQNGTTVPFQWSIQYFVFDTINVRVNYAHYINNVKLQCYMYCELYVHICTCIDTKYKSINSTYIET